MNIKSLVLGIIIGAGVTTGVFLLFGDEIRGNVSSATREMGKHVEDVGKTIEKTGKKLR